MPFSEMNIVLLRTNTPFQSTLLNLRPIDTNLPLTKRIPGASVRAFHRINQKVHSRISNACCWSIAWSFHFRAVLYLSMHVWPTRRIWTVLLSRRVLLNWSQCCYSFSSLLKCLLCWIPFTFREQTWLVQLMMLCYHLRLACRIFFSCLLLF